MTRATNTTPVQLPDTIRHGTSAAYLRHGCRCDPCSTANTSYHKKWRHERHRGVTRTVPADQVRAHIDQLTASGMTTGHIAAIAGLKSHRVVWGIQQPDRVYVQRAIADAILAVQPGTLPRDLDDQDETFVPAEPVRRRIRALLALGWTHDHMRERSGVSSHVVLHQASPRVTWRTYRRVADMYDELSMTPGPSRRTRERARRLGYAPPLAWDDDFIDADTPRQAEVEEIFNPENDIDEVAVERFIGGDMAWNRLTTTERLEAAARMDRAVISRNEIAARTHLNSRTLWDHLKAVNPSAPVETIAS